MPVQTRECSNVFAAILAGGSGTRMGNVEKPKQFMMLGDAPIIVHTIEKFCVSGAFDGVVVLTPQTWVQQTSDLVRSYCSEFVDMVKVVPGGQTRNATVKNAVAFLREQYDTNDQTVVVTHDAVRPFVTHRIIMDNIEAARRVGACDTVVPATDTIVESDDGESIGSIPDRRRYYQGQTPQSFLLEKLSLMLDALSEEEAAVLTDACKVFVLRGEQVALVNGDTCNIKITFPEDLRIAGALLGDPRA